MNAFIDASTKKALMANATAAAKLEPGSSKSASAAAQRRALTEAQQQQEGQQGQGQQEGQQQVTLAAAGEGGRQEGRPVYPWGSSYTPQEIADNGRKVGGRAGAAWA